MLSATLATDPRPAIPPAWPNLASGSRALHAWSDASESTDLAAFSWQGRDSMHARYYNPNIARFLSVDPGRDVDPKVPQAWNMYAYVRNNPVNQTDPDGNAVNLLWDIPDLAIGAVSIGNLWVKALSGQQITVSDNIDAISGAVGMLPIITGTAVGGKLVTFASKADDAADAARATEKAADAATSTRINKLSPDPQAQGPHTSFKRSAETGRVSGYETYDASGNPVKRFRGEGRPHGGSEPPLVLEPKPGKGPGAPPKVPRRPTEDEIPRGYPDAR